MSNSSYIRHPAHVNLSIESYLGTRVEVFGKSIGTLCFFSLDSHGVKITSIMKEQIKLMAQWIGYELEKEKSEALIQHQFKQEILLKKKLLRKSGKLSTSINYLTLRLKLFSMLFR